MRVSNLFVCVHNAPHQLGFAHDEEGDMVTLAQPRRALFVLALLVLPTTGWTQTTASIAGVVRDATGAVLPGVTVEASSPVLIEKVRTVVTDAQGQYKIVDLRPGEYTVTFTLAGFGVSRREGIAISAGFTASVNADLRVGALEETVTVSGATPVVDVQNVRTQNVLTRDTLDSLPGIKSFANLVNLTVGATGGTGGSAAGSRDVGGNSGEAFAASFLLHGNAADGKYVIDGMPVNEALGAGTTTTFHNNAMATEEVVLSTGGKGAESPTGGVDVIIISKDGGNRFSGSFNVEGSSGGLQGSNVNDVLRAQGVTPATLKKMYDVGVGVGGPIKRDRIWFYSANRWWGTQSFVPGVYYNKFPNTLFYEADLTRPANNKAQDESYNQRVTWQATSKQKISWQQILARNCGCFFFMSTIRAPEAGVNFWFTPLVSEQATWSYAASNRLLFEAGGAVRFSPRRTDRVDPTTADAHAILDIATGINYGAYAGGSPSVLGGVADWTSDYGPHPSRTTASEMFRMSYVTGSHAIRTGFLLSQLVFPAGGQPNHPLKYIFNNRVPIQLYQMAAPNRALLKVKADLGLFAEDQWTIKRLTLNLGARFDYFNAFQPAQTRPGGQFVPETFFPEANNLPNFKDISPRIGAAWDVFGDGRTAVKATVGRFLASLGAGIAAELAPIYAFFGTSPRTWTDVNGNYVPDCDLKSARANGECGDLLVTSFGTVVSNTSYADEARLGWFNREYNWQTAVAIQQELRPGIGVGVAYYRRTAGNRTALDNLVAAPEDFGQFCVTAPTDGRIPGGGGNTYCGNYNLSRAATGAPRPTSNRRVVVPYTNVYDGVDVTLNARFGRGLITGGFNTGKTVDNTCAHPDTPNALRCETVNGWANQSNLKFSAVYTLPWDFQASVTWINLPGIAKAAIFLAPNAVIAPQLGRNLGACAPTGPCTQVFTLDAVEPFSEREARQNQVDLRFTKVVRVGSARIRPRVDIFNLLNAASPQTYRSTVLTNPAYGNIASVLSPRFVKLGATIDF